MPCGPGRLRDRLGLSLVKGRGVRNWTGGQVSSAHLSQADTALLHGWAETVWLLGDPAP